MAANEYYQSGPPPTIPLPPKPQPHYQQETAYTPDPAPYSSSLPYPTSDQPPNRHDNRSPFATPFDDRTYPMGPMGRPSNTQYDSQSSLGGDTRYYGRDEGDRPQDSTGSFRDDIPLQPHHPQVPPKDHYLNDNDHVYDAPPRPSHLEAGQPVRPLGDPFVPVKKSKWKIAWVCYILGAVQVAVFIAEIVRSSKSRLSRLS